MTCARGCCESQIDHYRSLSISPAATPTRSGTYSYTSEKQREKNWNKDMPAYKQLVDQGYQPPSVDGAAELRDRAVSKQEIESGQLLPTRSERQEYEAITNDKLDS